MRENREATRLIELVQNKQFRPLKEELSGMNEVDIAEFLDQLEEEQQPVVFRILANEQAE